MTSEPREPSSSDPTADELRLGELLERFEELREENPSVGIGLLREEAGPLFPDLLDLADGLRLIRVRLGEEEEDVPAAVGRYRILERIAAGAVGVVYRAEDPRSGQVVAVKVMHESLSMSREALTRFQREVAATQNLGHDHVVRTLGCGESDGRLYLVMEYVEGVALGDVLRRIREEAGPRPDERWLAILDEAGVPPVETPGKNAAETYARRLAALLAPAADALRVAAEAGLVHRDLKPANLLLRRDGKLLVTDFGIAKIDGEDITSTVAVLGTPRFMSPEQASGDSRGVDARTDVYGLGAVLYHALTLEHPVSGDTFEELLAAIVHQRPVPVAERCAAYPRGLSWLVSRCLEKDPDDRYPTAGTLADDLGRIARGERPLAARLPLTRRATRFLRGNRIVLSAAAVVLILGAITFGWLSSRPGEVEIRVLPKGAIALNGEFLGPSPWIGELPRGEHDLLVTRKGFAPHRETLVVGAGQSMRLQIPLRPADPFDRDAVRALLEAHGLPGALPEGEPQETTMRGGLAETAPWVDRVTAVGPRGLVSRDGLVLRLRSVGDPVALRVQIGTADAEAPAFDRTLELGPGGLDLPLEGLDARVEHRVVLRSPGTGGHQEWTFRIADEPGLAARRDALPESLRQGPEAEILAIAGLLEAGLASEAFAAAEALAGSHADRTLPDRLALEALDRLACQHTPLYAEILARFRAAR
jgi:serine/threonine protein kinase